MGVSMLRGAAPASIQCPVDVRACELGSAVLGVDPRGFGEAAFCPVELDLAVVAVPAHRKMAVARERAIFDAVGDEFVDRERQRLCRFVVELDLGTGDGGEPLGRYARHFEFAAADAAELDPAQPEVRQASCGESVCQYGELRVEDGREKKQK